VISLDMPDADYRAVPALSYSGAKDLMRSPALFAHRLMHPRPDSTEFDVGHATHALLLGTGQPVARGYHPETGEPFKDWRTKDAKAFAKPPPARAGKRPCSSSRPTPSGTWLPPCGRTRSRGSSSSPAGARRGVRVLGRP
jgi:hypothetical protein